MSRWKFGSSIVALGLVLCLTVPSYAVPLQINQEGLVLDQGLPRDGLVSLTFSLYDAAEGGQPLWLEVHEVELIDGYYQVRLGEQDDLGPVMDGNDRFMGISVDGAEELAPRQSLGSVAYAMIAARAEVALNAEKVDGLDSTKFMRVDGDTGTGGDLVVGGLLGVDGLLEVGGGPEGFDSISIIASSAGFPRSDGTNNHWSRNGAPWATPMLYRSKREPNDGSGSFPFNNYGELIMQGTSHGRGYNRGISMVTTNEATNEPQVRLRVNEEGYVGIGTTDPRGSLHVYYHGSERLKISGDVWVAGATDLKFTNADRQITSPGTLRINPEGNLLLAQNGSNVGIGNLQAPPRARLEVNGSIRATGLNIGGNQVIDGNGQINPEALAAGGGAGVPPGAMVLAERGDEDTAAVLEQEGFERTEFTVAANGPIDFDFNNGGWRRGANMPGRLLWNSGAACGGKFYAMGGHSGDRTVYEYTPANNSWRGVAGMPSPRYAFACDCLTHGDGQEYVHCIGGQSGGYLNVNEGLNVNSNSWSTNYARMGTGLYCVQGATYNNRMYVFGGYNGNVYDWTQIYDPISNNWSRGANIPSGGRMEHNVAEADGRFYVVAGGGPRIGGAPTNRVDRYNPETNSWDTPAQAPYSATQPGVQDIGGRVFMFNGTGSGRGTSCNPCYHYTYEYNPQANNWTRRGDNPTRRAFFGSGTIANVLYSSGGEPWHSELDIYTVSASGVGAVTLNVYRALP